MLTCKKKKILKLEKASEVLLKYESRCDADIYRIMKIWDLLFCNKFETTDFPRLDVI